MLEKLQTEMRNPNTRDLDKMTINEILTIMNNEDKTVPTAVFSQLGKIEEAVKLVQSSFKKGGRLIYAGAGTSGRLGILDAVECTPTFGTPKGMVVGLIAGGDSAFIEAVEGAEDDEFAGERECERLKISEKDTVIALAASGRTPYAIGLLKAAESRGVRTVSICCNKHAEMSKYSSVAIEVETGPEVLTGSTRLKAGTAQKLVLNMISTASMVGVGKVYQNLMVDVLPTNKKLVERAKRIIMAATDVSYDAAAEYYQQAQGHVKTAIVMILLSCNYEEAKKNLQKAQGFIRETL
ncbi:N-acetylmuramic acid 6-phosphate etherase [Mesobacillus subterraneus]|uniref:N-acetylmuramic acid 6-phosphate etherase n=1 Tax=Mesobacillus subterraneus TaxID=285983 RepID=A0A0D6ZEX7_9BACI|nr:N-acetylmuramic acid 6-phosphate etherase [Mesobacillus subterraneus]KIY23805.1 N-acetylmuramic acid-6-phosphate etherase [Mesobacillus subterraneus]